MTLTVESVVHHIKPQEGFWKHREFVVTSKASNPNEYLLPKARVSSENTSGYDRCSYKPNEMARDKNDKYKLEETYNPKAGILFCY